MNLVKLTFNNPNQGKLTLNSILTFKELPHLGMARDGKQHRKALCGLIAASI